MSKRQTLRALVSERLTVAAEEIFGLFERTIAEYEEELCRSKEEIQRKQELLDSVLSPRVVLLSAGFQLVSASNTQTPQMKEEPEEKSVTQEREQLHVPVPESYADCVKTEESSLLQQTQPELREKTHREDISSELHLYLETERDTVEHFSDTENDEYWSPPFSCPTAQMETEAVGDHYSQAGRGTAAQSLWLPFRDSTAPGTSSTVNNPVSMPEDLIAEVPAFDCRLST
ncbi:uncharacterized protein LOC129456814 [Periophthalmus magnuspinnatus]|uniref:uncharacterized protein LOC129456814 n=1 Tax=Periophthalmus magnuspinnatus TaxID=409849 RepID=UPI002436D5D2|nr:uncharacterized protein LOC129456814 [Periophthalmus magnuspinnatus]